MKTKIAIYSMVCLLSLSGCALNNGSVDLFSDDKSVTVSLFGDEHVHVDGSSIKSIQKNGDVSFGLSFDDQYIYSSNDGGGNWSGQTITFQNVTESATYHVFSKPASGIHITIQNNDQYGTVSSNLSSNDDYVKEGQTIQISVTPKSGYHFTDWSKNSPDSAAMPYNFERTFSFVATEDVAFYANYYLGKTDASIHYMGNGGATQSGDSEVYYNHTINNHLRINTAQGGKMFYREGYLLDSWNTKEDGTGERIGLGSRISKSLTEEEISLYAIWDKETSDTQFQFALNNDNASYAVTGCSSADDTIVVPESHDSLPVTQINQGSFQDLQCKKICIPKTVLSVEESAFSNLQNLTEFLMSDTLENITDQSFANTTIKTLSINSFLISKFCGKTYQCYWTDKVDILISLIGKPKILFVGNSNTLYSINADEVSKYTQLDFLGTGVQSGIGILPALDTIEYYCKSDRNFIVMCPEFGADASKDIFTYHFLISAESNYDLLRIINSCPSNGREYSRVFTAYRDFASERIKLEKGKTLFDEGPLQGSMIRHGLIEYNPAGRKDLSYVASLMNVDADYYSKGSVNYLRNVPKTMPNTKIFYSCCSYNTNSFTNKEYLFGEYQSARNTALGEMIISKLEDYAFPGNYFYSDNYHLVIEGAIERTRKLMADLMPHIP